MREYFLNLLGDLDKLAGLKQLDKIYAVHGDNIEGAKAEIKKLLDVLCNVSAQFPMIPNADQQKIITQSVITEDFPSLNGNVLYKWLSRYKDKFMGAPAKEPETPQAPPLTGEARLAAIKRWAAALAQTDNTLRARPMSEGEIKTEGKEWTSEIDRKAVSVGFKKTGIEKLKAHDLHMKYVKECYDPYTGKPNDAWMLEDQWLELNSD